MRSFLLLIIISAGTLLAQFSDKDLSLIQSTAERNLDRNLIDKYLNADGSDSINAALLSISNCRDTSYIDNILGLKFDQNAEFILFALGQLGKSSKSTKYLTDKFSETESSKIKDLIMSTIGLTADSTIVTFITDQDFFQKGFATAFVNLNNRGIFDSSFFKILIHKLQTVTDDSLRSEILYALYRIGPTKNSGVILQELINRSDDEVGIDSKLYALGCLRKLKLPPGSDINSDKILSNSDWRIRTEAAKSACYYTFDNKEKLSIYFDLLTESNPNVSRTAATSLKNMTVIPEQLANLVKLIEQTISTKELPDNTSGEAFISLCALNANEIPKFINQFSQNIKPEFINRSILYYNLDPNWSFEFLSEQISDAKEKDLLHILPSLLSFQESLSNNENFNKIIFSLLRSHYASTISIVADGLDSAFIFRNSQMLQQLVFEQTMLFVNDPNFIESIFSLVFLSSKISKQFEESVLDILQSSKLASIKSFAASRRNSGKNISTPKKGLNDIIGTAFKYNYAEINTDKGLFKIKFLPEFAPVSVGNFCKLAEEKYFDGVIFHRVVPNFVIQSGDTSGTGWSGPGYEIVSEFSPLKFDRGTVGMASAGYDTEGSQWFVMHGNFPHLNGRYSIFGEVTEGMNTVDNIDQNDRIISIVLKK